MSKKHNQPVDNDFLDELLNFKPQKKNDGQQQSGKQSGSIGLNGLDSLDELFNRKSKDPYPQAPVILQPEQRQQAQMEADKLNEEAKKVSDRLSHLNTVYDASHGEGASEQIQQAAAARPADTLLDGSDSAREKREKTWGQRGKEFEASLAVGIDQLGSMAAKIPSYAFDMALKIQSPTNPMASLDAEDWGKLAEAAGVIDQGNNPLSPNNAVAEYYERRGEENSKGLNDYKGGITDAWASGNYKEAGIKAAQGVVQSLPITAGIIGGSIAGAPQGVMLGMLGMGSGADEYKRLKQTRPDMDKKTLFVNSVFTGLSESLSETLPVGEIYRQSRRLFASGAKKQAEEALRTGLRGYLDASFRKFFIGSAATTEGVTEAVNAITKNAIDKWSGVDPNRDYITPEVFDSFIIGMGSGAVIGAGFKGMSAATSYVRRKANKQTVRTLNQQNDTIQPVLDNPNAKPEVKEKLMEEFIQNNERINDIIDSEQHVDSRLNQKEKDAVANLTADLDRKESLVNDPTIPAPIKEQTKKTIDEIEKSVDEIINKAETRVKDMADMTKKLKAATTPEQVQKLFEAANDFANDGGDQVEYKLMIEEGTRKLEQLSKQKPVDAEGKPDGNYVDLLAELDASLDELKKPIPAIEEQKDINVPVSEDKPTDTNVGQLDDTDTNVGDKTEVQEVVNAPDSENATIEPEVKPQPTKKTKPVNVLDDLDASLDALKMPETEPVSDTKAEVSKTEPLKRKTKSELIDERYDSFTRKKGTKPEPTGIAELDRVGELLQATDDHLDFEGIPNKTFLWQVRAAADVELQSLRAGINPNGSKVDKKDLLKRVKNALPYLEEYKELLDEKRKEASETKEVPAEKVKSITLGKKNVKYDFVGTNQFGQDIYENEDGIRAKEAAKGIFSQEKVSIIPTRSGVEIGKTAREEEFKTIDEIKNEQGSPNNQPTQTAQPADTTETAEVDNKTTAKTDLPASSEPVIIPKKGDTVIDKKGKSTVLKVSKPVKGSALYGKETHILDIKREDGSRAMNMPLSSFTVEVTTDPTPKTSSIKDKLSSVKEELAAAKKEFFDAHRNINAGINPEILAKGIKLMSVYAKAGVLTFADIASDIANDGPELLKEVFNSLKAAYVSYSVNDATDEQLEEMTDLKAIKALKVEEFINDETNDVKNETDGTLPDTLRDNEGEMVSTEQSATPAGDISEGEIKEGIAGDSTESLRDAGRPDDRPGDEGGRSDRDSERGVDSTGKRTSRKATKPKSSTEDNGGAGQLKEVISPDSPEHNFIIDEKTDLVPEGEVGKINANMNAILLLRQLESENRNPTPSEKATLAKFVGWGGLAKYANGDVNDKMSEAIFSGTPTKVGFYSWSPTYTPTGALQTEGRTFEEIVADFRKEYQRAASDYEIKKALPYNAVQDNVSLEFARQQVLSKLLTEDELDNLKQSTTSAFYTDRRVISSMWEMAKQLGFTGGTVIESSAGIGHFFGLMPTDIADTSTSIGVEIDSLTGRMLKKLYPQNQIYVKGFEQVKIANNSVDFAIGNVPFGKTGLVHDAAHPDIDKFSLHNYFIAKNLKLLKPGGIAMLISSASTMDSAASIQARRWFSSLDGGNSDFIGAIRLPNNAFDKNAGTQVTSDILIFKKRTSTAVNTENFFTTENIRSEIIEGQEGPERVDIEINEYYIKHPENMIGEMKFANEVGTGGLYGGYTPTLHAKPGTDVLAKIKELTSKLPSNIYKSEPTPSGVTKSKIFSNEKIGKIFIKDGGVFVSEGNQATPVELKYKTHTAAVSDYVPLRDRIYPLLEAEMDTNATDKQIADLRQKLNDQYDKFISKHGYLNKHSSWLFELDVDYPLVAALEHVETKSEFTKDGKLDRIVTVKKGDLLTKRVNYPISIPTKADNFEDAVRISVSYKGNVNPGYIAELMSTDIETAKQEMIDKDLVYENPVSGLLETKDNYLSGQVRTKLEQAQTAARENPAYQRNVDALEDVQPQLIPASGIEFKVGVSYLPISIYKSFIQDILGVDADITYIESIGQWEIKSKGDTSDSRNLQTYAVSGTDHKATGLTILADTMSNRSTIIKTKGTKDFPPVIEEAATSAASDMQAKLNQEFQRYVKKNEELREVLETEYNKRFNNYVEPKTSLPSFEYYPGAVNTILLRVHQRKAVLRALANNTLLAHDVGTGKTFTQITIAMELRRLGLAKKPMIVVKNSTLNDFAASFKRLYPTAKILVLSKDEINAKNRKLFFGRIATGDWDAVIVPHSQFDMIPDKPERIMNFIKEKLEEMRALMEQTEDHFMKNRLKKEMDALYEQMDSLLLDDNDLSDIKEAGEQAAQGHKEKSKARSQAKKEGERIARIKAAVSKVTNRKTDNLLNFDEMNVDALLIDESHSYKKLGFQTNIQKVKGIDVAASKKAVAAYLKTQAVMERTGGKNVIFATGTPVTNTMAELWTNMRFLIPNVLRDMGIQTFDQFQQSFTEIGDSIEQNAGGKFEVIQRLARFYNLPELIKTFRSFADVVTTDDIPEFKADPDNAPPELKGGKIQAKSLPTTGTLKSIMLSIADKYAEYKAMSGKEKRENSALPLILYSIGKTAPIDPRLVDPNLPDDEGSKANAVVSEVLRLYKDSDKHKGTQMIFSDYIKSTTSDKVRDIIGAEEGKDFNLYEDIKQKLIKGGIPENQIALMSDAKYNSSNSDAAKKKLFDLMNQGTIRVVIGSTEKMGVGVNAQERMIGLHHLDAPARPDMFTQRNGRILRQGNMFAAMGIPVEVRAYGMEGTSDSTAFQRLEKKQGFITQIMKGEVTERSIDDAAAEEQENIDDFFAELGASLSGNKDALKLVMVKKDLRKEENRLFSYQQKLQDAEISLRKQKIAVPRIEEKIKVSERVLDAIETNFPEGKIVEVTIGGKTYTEKIAEEIQKRVIDKLAEKLKKVVIAKHSKETRSEVIKINGLDTIILLEGVKGKDDFSINLSFRLAALEIGTEFDDNASSDWETKDYDRNVYSNTSGGMLQLIRNDITRAFDRPESLKKLLDKTKNNITQLEEDLKETFDETKLKKLQKEKVRLDELVVAGGKHYEARKLDNESFYVFNIDKQEEVKSKDGDDTKYYKTLAEANQAAALLNADYEAEKIDIPHANIQKALDILESSKIKPGKTFALPLPIPPAVWNAAIDVVKAALKAGNTAQQALRAGVRNILENGGTKDQATEFYNLMLPRLGVFEQKLSQITDKPKTTTLRNADVEEKREEYGFDEPKPRKGTTNEEFREKATEELKKGFDVYGLMNRIEAGEAIQGWEEVALAMFQGNKEAELMEVDKLIEETPSSNAGDFNALVARRDKIMEDMMRSYDMSEKAGTFASDVMRARKVRVAQDMSLAGMIAKSRKAGKGKPLSPQEIDTISTQFKEMKQAMKDIEKETKRLQSENDKLKAQLALKKELETRRKQKKAGTISELKAERENLLADWRKELRKTRSQANAAVPYLNELIVSVPYVTKLARNLVEQGVTEIADVVRALHEEFVQEIPDLTEEDILEILSGKYSEPKQTKNEIQQELMELKKQATLLLKIKDAELGLERSAPGRPRAEASEKVKQLREQLKRLSQPTEEEQAEKDLKAKRERITKRIDELNRKIAEGDFSKPEKPEPVSSPELDALKDELIRVKFEYEKALATRMLETRTKGEKYHDYTVELLNLPRSIMSSVDFSAPLRQGLVATVSHPVIAAGAAKEMLSQAFSQQKFDRWLFDLQNSEDFVLMQQSGLYVSNLHNAKLSAREEQFMSNLAEKIPFFGKLIKGSERAYIGYLNKFRADLFRQMVDVLETDGYTFASNPDVFKSAASFVNNATGRGSMTGKMEQAAPLLNTIFFSPRLIASRLNLMNPVYYAKMPKPVRAMAIKDFALFLSTATSVLALFALSGSGDNDEDRFTVEIDPRSSDFAKVRTGNVRYDILGGLSQYIRASTQFSMAERKSTTTGEIKAISKEVFPFEGRTQVALNLLRSKLAPIPGMAWNLADGEDMVGNSYTWKDTWKNFVPLVSMDIASAVEDKGVKSVLTVGLPAIFGVSVQTYGKRHTDESDKKQINIGF